MICTVEWVKSTLLMSVLVFGVSAVPLPG